MLRRRAWPLGVLLAGLALAGPPRALAVPPESAPAPWGPAVDAAILDAVSAGDLPGAVVVVGQGDRVLHRKALGWRALRPRLEPVTLDTVFDLASLTKVVATTPAVLALWEDGRLELDAPLGRYLPEFQADRFRGVTVRRILLHTAGLPDPPRATGAPRTLVAFVREIAQTGLVAPPGTAFRYVDTGFILLGEVVRRVSGQPLDEFTRKRFYDPLGMASTRFRPPAAWHSRIAPTEALQRGLLRGEVHDGYARALGGVAGHAGLFSTAHDLERFVRMLLAGGAVGGRRYLRDETIRTMFEAHTVGETTRALGWDVSSSFARTLGAFFPPRSVGHTGYTGTALWLDPGSRSYLVLLTNRVHPDGRGNIAGLRRGVSAAVGAHLFGGSEPPGIDDNGGADAVEEAGRSEAPPVRTGLDRLAKDAFALLAARSVGLVTNQTGVDARGRRGIDLLAARPDVRLRAVFSPEHGLDGTRDESVPHARDRATGLPVWSLYGPERRPTLAMLAGLDTLVVDLQDVGVRYYTYLTTLVYVLEEAARARVRVVVLDRPNPITGRHVEGPLMDPDLRSFTAPHPVPVRTGLTIGEFARLVVAERSIPVDLAVIPLEGWRRGEWFDETGLPWLNPSPNIRSPNQALLYAGVGLLEATNLSVGRGTDTPFELVGAPWIDNPLGLADALNALALPGIRFEPARFTPTASEYAGQAVAGVRLRIQDRDGLRPVRLGLALARVLRERYPAQYRPAAIQDLLVNRRTIWAFFRDDGPDRLVRWLEVDEASFRRRREPYLLYR